MSSRGNTMDFKDKTIGFALTGSFCTIRNIFPEIEKLVRLGANVIPIISEIVNDIDTKFIDAKETKDTLHKITGNKVLSSIKEAEPFGPSSMLDALVIAPATGNTISKIANAITDSVVTMAYKAHSRNNKPVILSISTNDALAANAKNIGSLLNYRNVFFTPFYQDDPVNKKFSLASKIDLIIPTIQEALNGNQIQPILFRTE